MLRPKNTYTGILPMVVLVSMQDTRYSFHRIQLLYHVAHIKCWPRILVATRLLHKLTSASGSLWRIRDLENTYVRWIRTWGCSVDPKVNEHIGISMTNAWFGEHLCTIYAYVTILSFDSPVSKRLKVSLTDAWFGDCLCTIDAKQFWERLKLV